MTDYQVIPCYIEVANYNYIETTRILCGQLNVRCTLLTNCVPYNSQKFKC